MDWTRTLCEFDYLLIKSSFNLALDLFSLKCVYDVMVHVKDDHLNRKFIVILNVTKVTPARAKDYKQTGKTNDGY